jgi:cytoskeleton protein RodZ
MDDARENLSTVGELLREARNSRGFTLVDAERETKIRQKYLTALEEDDVSSLPGPLYVRGFLRKYAAFLGMDPDEVLHIYDAQSTPSRNRIRAARGEPLAHPKGKDPNAINIQPLSPEKLDTRVRYGVSYVALSLLAIPLIIIFYFIYSAYSGPGTNPPIVSTQTARVPTVTTLPPTVLAGVGTQVVPTPIVTPTLEVTGTVTLTGTQTVDGTAIAVDGTAGASPAPVDGISLQVRTTNDAWVRITVDGRMAFEGTLARGTTRTWTGEETIKIRSGRSSSVGITVNGSDKGRLRDPNSPDQQGEDNEIVEKEWNAAGEMTVIQK